ncbi:Nudix family hydrolase [Solemya velesiana gill symbiont]|uniref:8-oxo-dGTP diphosphatase n=1 Tax=Solemya velesiana gill symbiont TaxID=1918948 RepID=A0A1T2KWX2_9GAMM|nr:Nudix family hydrolase [Solemya velesiana gill symbiont]OOZ37301.1 hypothetical protein BOW51_03255 [Solemya velesiana gill symbiont]
MRHVHVAVAVIADEDGRILLTRRHDHLHQGGLWEFPGGKVEEGETISQALKREIREELGIDVSAHFPLIRVKHDYSDKSVLLDVHRVTAFDGSPKGLEGQPLSWVMPEKLGAYPLPEADHPIVNAVNLPADYMITGPDPERPEEFLARLGRALGQGLRLVQLRAPGLTESAFRTLAQEALSLCRNSPGARLILNSDPRMVTELGADGVHLNSRRLMALDRRPLPEKYWVAASCHNLEELRQAERIGVDFVVLSPVCRTANHPGAEPLGWERFREWVEEIAVPVYALGGMTSELLDQARTHGAQGFAAIRGLWPVD